MLEYFDRRVIKCQVSRYLRPVGARSKGLTFAKFATPAFDVHCHRFAIPLVHIVHHASLFHIIETQR
jgi:hypothetical protein